MWRKLLSISHVFTQIVERLYLLNNILSDAYGYFGKSKRNQKMKAKTINIIIQIKELVSLLAVKYMFTKTKTVIQIKGLVSLLAVKYMFWKLDKLSK